jgi:hypothetical protein
VIRNISWNDWLLVDLAIGAKGLQNLDAQEKHIIGQALEDEAYCSQKYVPQ